MTLRRRVGTRHQFPEFTMRDMKIHEEKRGDNGWALSPDLAAAYGGWWREIGTTIERARG